MKKRSGNQGGFTIIEVMIVLAIAGIVMLIVFLAVPALQRSSRNTQRKNDIGILLGAVNEYVSNKNGKLPTTTQDFSLAFSEYNPTLGYFTTAADVDWNYVATSRGATAPSGPTTADAVIVYNFLKCDSNGVATTSGATARSVAALYRTETSSSLALVCQEG